MTDADQQPIDEPGGVTPPSQSRADRLKALARTGAEALISELPLGGLAVALLSEAFPKAFERRLEAWRTELATSLEALAARGVDVDSLRDDDEFIGLVVDITTLAIQSRSEAKRTLLRNALTNSVLPSDPGRDKRDAFLRFVDTLSELHLEALTFYADPGKVFFDRTGFPIPEYIGPRGAAFDPSTSDARLTEVRKRVFPSTSYVDVLVRLATDELVRLELIDLGRDLGQLEEICRNGDSYTTRFGDEFYAFVSEPPSR